MNHKHLFSPWAGPCDLYSAPGSLILKIALGEAPEAIPSALEVRFADQDPATRMSIGAVDRLFNHFADRVRITRIHTPAASFGSGGNRRKKFDDIEHVIGLSRTFRIDANHSCCISDLVDALRQISMVEQAYPHYLSTLPFASAVQVPSPDQDYAWLSREQVHTAEAMAYESGDPAVIIAVVDTGVVQSHTELHTRLRSGLDTVQLVIDNLATGITLIGDRSTIDTDPEDNVGHGTSCAAIISAAGEHIPPGLAGECGLLPIRVLGAAQFPGKSEPVGIGAIADIDQGVKSAIDLGAKVVNMSFGTPESALQKNDPQPHQDVVLYGLARGCIMIAASGNSGKAERYSPASLDGVITIGAVDNDGQPTSFSTKGHHVALCAPGERVISAGLNGYTMVTGTSFAAPFVAAAAGLLVSRAGRRSYPLDGLAVRKILCDSAQPWSKSQGEGHGYGILDAHAALLALEQEIDHFVFPGLSPPNDGTNGVRRNDETNF